MWCRRSSRRSSIGRSVISSFVLSSQNQTTIWASQRKSEKASTSLHSGIHRCLCPVYLLHERHFLCSGNSFSVLSHARFMCIFSVSKLCWICVHICVQQVSSSAATPHRYNHKCLSLLLALYDKTKSAGHSYKQSVYKVLPAGNKCHSAESLCFASHFFFGLLYRLGQYQTKQYSGSFFHYIMFWRGGLTLMFMMLATILRSM